MRVWRRIAIGGIAALVAILVVGGLYVGTRQLQIFRIDSAYNQLRLGEPAARVFDVLGKPDEEPIARVRGPAFFIERYLVYRFGQKYQGGITWTIGLDEKGNIVSKHRDDDGC